jgi:hypothetical protein
VTIHYHGTPITPQDILLTLSGCHFCVSFSDARQVRMCHELGQSVMLDNGAFSAWKRSAKTDWDGYYAWADEWLDFPATWAVIPDVIEGTAEENDALLTQWPLERERGAPVWHMHEPLERLRKLAEEWPRICMGSSGEYAQLDTPKWHARMTDAWNELVKQGGRTPWVHMLRGMDLAGSCYPFASVDSTNVARNHARNSSRCAARQMAHEIDGRQCPGRWSYREVKRSGALFSALKAEGA